MRKLRPYQEQGFNSIFTTWTTHDVIMFVLATGGGKTFTFTEVIRRFLGEGKRCMLIAHRTELIEQSWQTLYDAQVLAGIIKSGHPAHFDRPCQVCSIQTIARRKKLPHADVIVIDESHHVQDDNSYGAILKMFPDALVLMVTATPYRLSGDGFVNVVPGKETQLIINSTLDELIREGWLVPLQYHIGSIPDLSGVDIVKGDYEKEGLEEAMGMAPLVESYILHCNGMQGLCFCVNKAHSKATAKQYNDAGISAVHVDDETTEENRRDILARYRAGLIKVVCNVGIFTEGTDFPFCQFVQLAAPSKSFSKILQEIGRGTRALPGLVDKYETAHERVWAIARSQKPFCIILDNAGTWIDHGFADDPVDWVKFFKGWRKPKKQTEEPEYIEIPVYEIMKPDGTGRTTTKIPAEVEGMILVKITKEMRINLRAMKHIKEFDRVLDFARNCPKMNKPGYWAYFRYREHCDSNGITIPEAAWQYVREKLVDEVEKELSQYLADNTQAGRIIIPSINEGAERIRAKGVHGSWLKKELYAYRAGDRSHWKADPTRELTI